MPSVSNQSNSANKNTTLIPNTISNIFIIGSPKDSNNNLKKELLLVFFISLLPYLFLDLTTSSSVSPIISINPPINYMTNQIKKV